MIAAIDILRKAPKVIIVDYLCNRIVLKLCQLDLSIFSFLT